MMLEWDDLTVDEKTALRRMNRGPYPELSPGTGGEADLTGARRREAEWCRHQPCRTRTGHRLAAPDAADLRAVTGASDVPDIASPLRGQQGKSCRAAIGIFCHGFRRSENEYSVIQIISKISI